MANLATASTVSKFQ